MREEMAELTKAVNGMGKQIDVLFQRQTGTAPDSSRNEPA